ncbi:MAG: hypothetical protein JJU02_05970 [Cryomorphaceae bacterium]|nr:hypothetical protein [Cryomorphaceae bacterium]
MNKICFVFTFFGFVVFSGTETFGQLVWDGKGNSASLGQEISYYFDSTGEKNIQQINELALFGKFTLHEKPILSFPISGENCWVKIDIENRSEDNLILEVSQPIIGDIELFFQDVNGIWKSIKSGYNVTLDEKVIRHHLQLFPLTNEASTYFLKFKSNGLAIPINVYEESHYQKKITRQLLIKGIYVGIMVFVVLYNLFLFFSLRIWVYFHYVTLVIFWASLVAIIEGYILYALPNIDLYNWYIFNPILNTPNGVLYCIFFLELRKYTPKFFKISIATLILIGSYIFWNRFLPNELIVNINQLFALLVLLVLGANGIAAGRNGNRLGYLYSATYLIFFLIASIEVIYINTGSPNYIFEISYVGLAIFFEVLMIAYLLSKRFEWEKIDIEQARLNAQQKLLEKTLENEKIVKEQNIHLEKVVKKRTSQLQSEIKKSDELLYNILPVEVAKELKQKGSAVARYFENVSVLFTDFVNFTQVSENLKPTELVETIHQHFTAFDFIIEKYGLEKIKTIGDAYLAVSGLPITVEHHAKNTVLAALEITSYMDSQKTKSFQTRIGINSGPVVAGIVGIKKFQYDIWGDTVNTAARMESSGAVGKVNISQSTYKLIKDDPQFSFESRGKIAAKGKGEIEMWFVKINN